MKETKVFKTIAAVIKILRGKITNGENASFAVVIIVVIVLLFGAVIGKFGEYKTMRR